jgi:hypothetical protein
VALCCKHGNEPSGSEKRWKCPAQLKDLQIHGDDAGLKSLPINSFTLVIFGVMREARETMSGWVDGNPWLKRHKP